MIVPLTIPSTLRDGSLVELRLPGSPEKWIKARWAEYGGTRARRVGWVSDEDGIYSNDSHFTDWRLPT